MRTDELSTLVIDRFTSYLQTQFYFRDAQLRESFHNALNKGYLFKGPYLEMTPTFKRSMTLEDLLTELMEHPPEKAFTSVLFQGKLYSHQARAIQGALDGHNIVVATGTGSGKTEAFIYPILLDLYDRFRTGKLGPGVHAMILYPMNALANDQRLRLGSICEKLEKANTQFRFTFGQYTGETPEDKSDSTRYAHDVESRRYPNELVFRSEMRCTPPNILLTN